MRILLFFLSSCIFKPAYTQNADFIVLKKKNKTIATYFSGSNIEFSSTTGAYINAYIYGIKNDTLFLQEFVVQQIPTNLGVFLIDTVGSYHYKYHYNQIMSIGPKPKRGFNIAGSGASLMGGGALLTLGSGVVWLADREKFSPGLLLGSAGLAGLGYLMTKSSNKGIIIGKKYKIIYMKMGIDKKM